MLDLTYLALLLAGFGLILALKALFWVYPRFHAPRAKLAAQLAFLALFGLYYALLLGFFLDAFAMMDAYGPALLAGLAVLVTQAFLVLVHHVTQSKRTLSERQKSELMDL